MGLRTTWFFGAQSKECQSLGSKKDRSEAWITSRASLVGPKLVAASAQIRVATAIFRCYSKSKGGYRVGGGELARMVGFLTGFDGDVEDVLLVFAELIPLKGDQLSVFGGIGDQLEEVRYHSGDNIPSVTSFLKNEVTFIRMKQWN